MYSLYIRENKACEWTILMVIAEIFFVLDDYISFVEFLLNFLHSHFGDKSYFLFYD